MKEGCLTQAPEEVTVFLEELPKSGVFHPADAQRGGLLKTEKHFNSGLFVLLYF